MADGVRESSITDGPQPILVAVDLTEFADHVLTMAGELADCLSRSLMVMHVVHDSDRCPHQYGCNHDDTTPISDVARDKLETLLTRQSAQHPKCESLHNPQIVLVQGLPANRILEVAERKRPKMIVVGSHGRGAISQMLLGSVAAAVTRSSQVPVTVIKPCATLLR